VGAVAARRLRPDVVVNPPEHVVRAPLYAVAREPARSALSPHDVQQVGASMPQQPGERFLELAEAR
jgi:hypothetical protein